MPELNPLDLLRASVLEIIRTKVDLDNILFAVENMQMRVFGLGRQYQLFGLLLLLGAAIEVKSYFDEEENYPRYLTAAVGDFIVLDCEIDFPQGYPIPYKLFWKRGVSDNRIKAFNTKMYRKK